jgi:glucose/arabinose dehydrogenase/endonuclease YncB( thermonuclease family)
MFLGIASLATISAQAQAPPPGSGSIDLGGYIRVIDGDTIETRINGRLVGIGIIGVRAARGNTPCGQLAINQLQALSQSRALRLEEDPKLVLDGLKRRLYYVVTPAGQSVARQLVRAGVARPNGKGRETSDLLADEQDARRNNRGCINAFPEDKDNRKDVVNIDFPASPGSVGGLAFVPDGAFGSSGNAGFTAAKVSASSRTAAVDTNQATTLPSGFSQQVVARNFVEPTGFVFLPDGRILVAEKRGRVLMVKNGAVLSTPFIDLQSRVNAYWDHGMLGITADSNFANNGYVYLLYTYENDPAALTGTKTQQLLRVKAVGDVASSAPADQTVILGRNVGASCSLFPAGSDCIPANSPNHAIGALRFATDGTLFVSMGDDTTYNVVDPDALRVQAKDVLTGKILRIDPATGAGLVTNPYYGETGDINANRSKVWAYGLRNPFRYTLRSDDLPFVGDVGWNTWEEIDIASPGANLGWPCYEGTGRQPGYEPLSQCQSLYSLGVSAVREPLHLYNHNGSAASVTGGAFYTGLAYPQEFRGAYLFGDYALGRLQYLTLDSNGNLAGPPVDFGAGADGPVDIQMGPDTNLYYLAINTAELRRIRYTVGNTFPTAAAQRC